MNHAVVIQVTTSEGNIRYFSSKKFSRIVTAWSLAGARLFLPDRTEEMEKIEKELVKRKLKVERKTVQVV